MRRTYFCDIKNNFQSLKLVGNKQTHWICQKHRKIHTKREKCNNDKVGICKKYCTNTYYCVHENWNFGCGILRRKTENYVLGSEVQGKVIKEYYLYL